MKIKHNKIKPQAVKDKAYLSWLHDSDQVCFVCGNYMGLEAHHVKENSSSKRTDDKVLMLCFTHHTGSEFSPHGTPSKFREKYPIHYQEYVAARKYAEFQSVMDR